MVPAGNLTGCLTSKAAGQGGLTSFCSKEHINEICSNPTVSELQGANGKQSRAATNKYLAWRWVKLHKLLYPREIGDCVKADHEGVLINTISQAKRA